MSSVATSSAARALLIALCCGVLGLVAMLVGFWNLMEPTQANTTAEATGPRLWPGLAIVLAGLALSVTGAIVLVRRAGDEYARRGARR